MPAGIMPGRMPAEVSNSCLSGAIITSVIVLFSPTSHSGTPDSFAAAFAVSKASSVIFMDVTHYGFYLQHYETIIGGR
jgi:hypothetical protein